MLLPHDDEFKTGGLCASDGRLCRGISFIQTAGDGFCIDPLRLKSLISRVRLGAATFCVLVSLASSPHTFLEHGQFTAAGLQQFV